MGWSANLIKMPPGSHEESARHQCRQRPLVGGGWLDGWLVGGGFKGAASQAALGLTPLQLSREQLGGKEIKFGWKSKCFWAWLSASWPSRPGLPSAAMVRSRNGCLIIKGEFLDMQVSVSPPSIRPWYFRISILSASLRPQEATWPCTWWPTKKTKLMCARK